MSELRAIECCGNCRFWLPQPPGKSGVCRRRAATVFAWPTGQVKPITGEPVFHTAGFFPPMNYQQWCGDHAPAVPMMASDLDEVSETKGAA